LFVTRHVAHSIILQDGA